MNPLHGTREHGGMVPGAHATTPLAIDASVGIGGYRNSLTDPLERATVAILGFWAEHGLTGVRIESSTWEELALLRALVARRDPGERPLPRITGGGPTLVDASPRSERDYWVGDPASIAAAVDTAVAHHTGWVNVRVSSTAAAHDILTAAHARGQRVCYRGPWHGTEDLLPGDHIPSVADLLREGDEGAVGILHRWADDASPGVGRGQELHDRGVTVGTELLALRRSVFLREALEAPFLEELEPVLPHAAYVRQMKRPGGYLVGKRQLRQHAGLIEPTRDDAVRAEDGWANLLTTVGQLPGPLIPATRSPQLTSLPGYSWREECSILRHAGIVDPQLLGVALFGPPD
ncbi:hypothetical protein [Arthrobacter sp. 260]|uniref:hypothetical protein n=1 Tax=Arthrobacter sp. 260 TaxID=2735314 RepID=UPI001490D934|nr:hypothetical protein [Arthrobacter sp. 260]NOJ58895.1 hypothetical protein [Arthrobacter sp. 260]